MTAAARLRPAVMAVALCATLGASAWTYWRAHRAEAAASVAAAVARPAPAPGQAPPAPTPATAAPDEAAPAVDLFAPTTWDPPPAPPPPPAAPVAPAPPHAPPLPFTYFGRTEVVGASGGALVHLRRDKDVFSVREGETFDEHYRLDKVSADTLEITYLPLNEQQIVATGPR